MCIKHVGQLVVIIDVAILVTLANLLAECIYPEYHIKTAMLFYKLGDSTRIFLWSTSDTRKEEKDPVGGGLEKWK
jgi:hypothetical protein